MSIPAHLVRSWLPMAAVLLLFAPTAAAVSITFSVEEFTLVDYAGPAHMTTNVMLRDLGDPDPNLATFEMNIVGTVFNDRSGLSAGEDTAFGFRQSETFFYFTGQSIFAAVHGGEVVQTTFETVGLEEPVLTAFTSGDFSLGDTRSFPGSHPPLPDFWDRVDWSARILVSISPELAGSLSTEGFFGAEMVECDSFDGVFWESTCDGGGAGFEGDARNVSFTTTVPEPSSTTLLGLGLAGLAARRRRSKSRRHAPISIP